MKRGNVSEKEPSDHKRLEEEKEREREKIPNGHWFLNLKEETETRGFTILQFGREKGCLGY